LQAKGKTWDGMPERTRIKVTPEQETVIKRMPGRVWKFLLTNPKTPDDDRPD
jgi:hypothetical protein